MIRGKSVLAICKFGIYKVQKMLVSWFLLAFSLLMFAGLVVFLFLKSSNIDDLVSNFHYGVLIFINIFLLLFILLIIIKIYGREFNDGTFLLLISRPYRRFELFFFKVITIWFLIVIFVSINMGMILGVSFIMNLIMKKQEFFYRCLTLVLPLFLFSLTISFVASSGFIFISTILSTQTVLLIGFIFCSLFLLGGMPYSLITQIANTKEISFDSRQDTQPYSIKKIKEIVLFKEKMQSNSDFKYFNLTKAIYDEYSKPEYTEEVLKGLISYSKDIGKDDGEVDNQINDVFFSQTNFIELRKKRLQFYNNLGLTNQLEIKIDKNSIIEGSFDSSNDTKLKNWATTYSGQLFNDFKNNYNDVQLKEIVINMPYAIKNKNELKKSNNQIHKDLLAMINDYLAQINFRTYAETRIPNIASLLYFDKDESYYSLSLGGEKPNLDANQQIPADHKERNVDWYDMFSSLLDEYYRGNSNGRYVLENDNQQKAFVKLMAKNFDNEVLFILETLEMNIIRKIYDAKIIANYPVKLNSQYNSYFRLMNVYRIISLVNVIEHMNQLWTGSFNENLYEFIPLYQSTIDFDAQKNYLMSYKDFAFKVNNNKKLVINYRSIPTLYLLLAYVVSALVLLIIAYLILSRKSIT